MATYSRSNSEKIVIGIDISQPINEPDKTPSGTAILNGPVVCGKVNKTQNNYEGVLNVSSDSVPQLPGNRQPVLDVNLAAKIDGNINVTGDGKTKHALEISGGSSKDTVKIIGDLEVTGDINGGNKGRLADRFNTADLRGKSFDLKHPTKDGYRLRHACVEGPEIGVYYRGRLKGSNIIELPEYWKNLVYEDSITVQLQPIGKGQNLVIESFNSEYVVIEVGANQDFLTGEILIDCFYHVYGERKDVNPLITEYEGDSWKDYPDPNWKLSPYNKDRNLKDPQYDYGQNVTTND